MPSVARPAATTVAIAGRAVTLMLSRALTGSDTNVALDYTVAADNWKTTPFWLRDANGKAAAGRPPPDARPPPRSRSNSASCRCGARRRRPNGGRARVPTVTCTCKAAGRHGDALPRPGPLAAGRRGGYPHGVVRLSRDQGIVRAGAIDGA